MLGFIFPGQGSQKPGMGQEISKYDNNKIISRSEEILGYSISDIMWSDDSRELGKTIYTQPAIFIVNHMYYCFLKEKGIQADVFAGHSLGEFNAYVSAGVLEFEKALQLVKRRGEVMYNCVQEGLGMYAVIGKDLTTLNDIIDEDSNVYVANFNSPRQIVISGDLSTLEIVTKEIEKSVPMSRCIKLNVSSAFHTPYMVEANRKFNEVLDNVIFKTPVKKLYSNVTGKLIDDEYEAKELLRKQMTSPVKWNLIADSLVEEGISSLYEVGYGNTLKSMTVACNKNLNFLSLKGLAND
jgi:[acyl-carrier-protein] S-malonyltransferase